MAHEGGCLCGKVRYAVAQPPAWVTVCHCRFCQRATGSAYMIEPIFLISDLTVLCGTPRMYAHRSEGSGQLIHVRFCGDCGTKLWQTFDRWPEHLGVFGGTFDDPSWFPITGETAQHIFVECARPGTVLPPGIACHDQHCVAADGSDLTGTVHAEPVVLPGRDVAVT